MIVFRSERVLPGLVLATALALSGCGSGGSSQGSADEPGAGDSGDAFNPQTSAASAEGLCSWPTVSNPDLLNIAYPDESATYWGAALPILPGTRVRIEGQYPQARYFSFNVYDPLQRPVDAIADFDLLPRVAGTNSFSRAGVAAGADYVAYIVPEPRPENPEPNTIYAGSLELPGGNVLPLNPFPIVLYRIYLPEVDGTGGVPLPRLTFESADGSQAPLTLGLCTPLPPEGTPPILNDLIREASFPGAARPSEAPPPRVTRFYNLFETLRVLISGQAGIEIPPNPLTESGAGGFLSNRDIAYVSALFRRNSGQLYVVRARAPTAARHPSDAPLGAAQLRYWSLCTNEVASQRFVACVHDAQVPLDALGYFTLVVSDPEDRPANAIPENGMIWLPWGGIYPDSLLIYRHMLPNPGFAEAIQNVPYGTPQEDVMGEYYPRAAYCDRATVEAAGNSPAAIFAACGG
jgi:hypothetical protein